MYSKNPRNHMTSTNKRFNLKQFNELYYNNPENCRQFFIKARFPKGYVCPECGNTKYHWLEKRRCIQCTKCCQQTHVLAGTIFENSKLSFYQILIGLFMFVTNQSGISGTTLAFQMSVNINTARLFLRKLREACKTSNENTILFGEVELDGAYFGGMETGGKRGLGSTKQTVMVGVQVETRTKKNGEKYIVPGKARFKCVESENGSEIVSFVQGSIKEGTTVYTDKGKGISVLSQEIKDKYGNVILDSEGCPRKKYNYNLVNLEFDMIANPLKWVHTFISNVKNSILGIYHGVNLQYAQPLLEEYNWRFNHRTEIEMNVSMNKLFFRAFQTKPITQEGLKQKYSK